jgi:hypothetical protein
MPATYEPISTQTLGTATADIFFNSIPQTYTDLVLVVTGTSASDSDAGFRLNSDNASNYSWTELYGTGSSAVSARTSSNTFGRFNTYGGLSTTGRYILIANFMNYTNATTFKSVLSRSGNTANSFPGTSAYVNLWRKTPEPITSINVLSTSGVNFAIGSTFTLYGIKAA